MTEFSAVSDLVIQESQGVCVAYNAATGKILELNGVGFHILRSLSSHPMSMSDLCDDLRRDYSGLPSGGEVEEDVRVFLADLEDVGFIKLA